MKLLWPWKFSVCQFPLKNIVFGAWSISVIVASAGSAYVTPAWGKGCCCCSQELSKLPFS